MGGGDVDVGSTAGDVDGRGAVEKDDVAARVPPVEMVTELEGSPSAPSAGTETVPPWAVTPPVKVLEELERTSVPLLAETPAGEKLVRGPASAREPEPDMTMAPPLAPSMVPEKLVLALNEPRVSVKVPRETVPSARGFRRTIVRPGAWPRRCFVRRCRRSRLARC